MLIMVEQTNVYFDYVEIQKDFRNDYHAMAVDSEKDIANFLSSAITTRIKTISLTIDNNYHELSITQERGSSLTHRKKFDSIEEAKQAEKEVHEKVKKADGLQNSIHEPTSIHNRDKK